MAPIDSLDAQVTLQNSSGLAIIVNDNGSIQRMDCGDIAITLFPGSEIEGGCTNIYLRRGVGSNGEARAHVALLGPHSGTRWTPLADNVLRGTGEWQGLRYCVALVLAADAPSWFWHVEVENIGNAEQHIDLIYTQDLALAPYAAVRTNEYYVSQYLDHAPLVHPVHGCVVASRQNQAAAGRYPWSLIGSLGNAVSYATDAMQFYGLAARAGAAPVALVRGLPGKRLQHEHALAGIQHAVVHLAPAGTIHTGFFGAFVADHPAATDVADLAAVDQTLTSMQAKPPAAAIGEARIAQPSLFTAAALLAVRDLSEADLDALFGNERGDVEKDASGTVLSFFYGMDRHVVLRAKELLVQRPHGHLLRTGKAPVPDEAALTSTTWMSGVFHSMVTQGHVSINRFLSTTRGYLGLFRSHGQRVFAHIEGAWYLLDVPSALEMTPTSCRWVYRHRAGTIEVRSAALSNPHELSLEIRVTAGTATRFLISHHVAMNGDDGSTPGAVQWSQDSDGISIRPASGSELAARFPAGDFLLTIVSGTRIEKIGGDELLFNDGRTRHQPYLCLITEATQCVDLRLRGRLIQESLTAQPGQKAMPALGGSADVADLALSIEPSRAGPLANQVHRLQNIIPWFIHNALIHYLSPRGLEQYSGGGWGTRDVSQGPVELLLACGHTTPVRDLLLRVFSAQNADGDWPQWFMFFAREREIRAGDSHGDIVFWPVLAFAQYLIASGDESLLAERIPFFGTAAADVGPATVWEHVERSLALIRRRVVTGTALAAYGHGDWNDSLQPADPGMREHMCSAWTVTLHRQMLITLARALRQIGREGDAVPLEQTATQVQKDFERLLIVDGVMPGYALFDSRDATSVSYLLHPRDATSGVHYSSLAMIHAILEDMLTPDQVRTHLHLIDEHLTGPDGIRLFDRPMAYHGGPQRFFQRAESATFFGREIGLMYMHAHLRYAQALAHLGEADRFFKALCQANPAGLSDIVPQATLRQANCYYSSSDAAFVDRVDASNSYERVAAGTIALDGGWRVYSSGAGIAFSLIVRRLLGLNIEAAVVELDPVIPDRLDGLRVRTTLFGRDVTLAYKVNRPGYGVSSLAVNGEVLAFDRSHNAYRIGAARFNKDTLIQRLRDGSNLLEISVGC